MILPAIFFLSCKKESDKAEVNSLGTRSISLDVPAHFPVAEEVPDNPLTAEGVELGRQLFYDTRLSGNNRLSCASCHNQSMAFTDGVALSSIGANGKQLLRHAMPLFNLAWADKGLFWDGGSSNLESQAFAPFAAEDEMHQNLTELEEELEQDPKYVSQFRKAFNSDIKSILVVKAIAQFERTLISGHSRFDQYFQKKPGIVMNENELMGMNLVKVKCAGCHSGILFTDYRFHNTGLEGDFKNDEHEGVYQGRFRISYDPADLGKFKTPSLRNVALTAPYMHDGRFKTLDQVLDHYASGVKLSASTDPALFQNGSMGIQLSPDDKKNILAFLTSLTDQDFITNKKFSKPN